MRSLAWLSEKGGTGKTTSAINTAVCMARMKKRVLLIDCRPPGEREHGLPQRGGRGPADALSRPDQPSRRRRHDPRDRHYGSWIFSRGM